MKAQAAFLNPGFEAGRRMRLLAIVIGIAILGFTIASWILADILIATHPGKVMWPVTLAVTHEEVSFTATDGVRLQGWFLTQKHSTKAILLLHGISADRRQMLQRACWLHDLGYNVLLYDARGCGESARVRPSFGYRETSDMLGAVNWLQSRGMTQVGCVGFSQGAATILLASGKLPSVVAAVVAEAPYATLRKTVDDHFRRSTGLPSGYGGLLAVPMAEWKLGINMNEVSPLREITKLRVPLYLIGGTSDTLAPPSGIEELYAAAPGEKSIWMVPWAGHGDFYSYAETVYKDRVGRFLKAYLSL